MIETKIIENVGVIYLAKPDLINALDIDMVRNIKSTLESWERDDNVRAVLLDSTSDKGFCSGGDLKSLYDDLINNEDLSNKEKFFVEEFDLDKYLSTYKKHVVSHWYGVTMGGGIGLTINSDFIIVDETVNWAMPETRLGFVPDVGVCHFISKLPQALGQYVGLLGKSLGASDVMEFGLADFYINSNDYDKAIKNLFNLSKDYSGGKLIEKFRESIIKYKNNENLSKIKKDLDDINRYFNGESIEDIFEKLNNSKDEFAKDCLEEFAERYPLMLKVQFEKYFVCKNLNYQDTIGLDLKILRHSVKSGSMQEGINAVIIDKNHKASWPEDSLAKVDEETIKNLLSIDKTHKEKINL